MNVMNDFNGLVGTALYRYMMQLTPEELRRLLNTWFERRWKFYRKESPGEYQKNALLTENGRTNGSGNVE